MTRARFAITLLIIALFPSIAAGQTPRLVPEWNECQPQTACFDMEGFRQLLLLEQELLSARTELQQLPVLRRQLSAVTEEREALSALLVLNEERLSELDTQLREAIEEKNRYRAEAEHRPLFGIVFGTVASAFAAGAIIALVVK